MRVYTNEIITAAKEEVKKEKTHGEFMLQDILKHVVINVMTNDKREIGKEFTATYTARHQLDHHLGVECAQYSGIYQALIKKRIKIDDEVLHKLGLATLEFNGATLNANSFSFTVYITYTLYNEEV